MKLFVPVTLALGLGLAAAAAAAAADLSDIDQGVSAEDLDFFLGDADEASDFTPRSLEAKKNPFRKKKPKCVAIKVKDAAGNDRCKAKGGKCVTSAAVCKRVTRGQGFYVPSLCNDANPVTEPRGLCGCCIKRPNKIKRRLQPEDLRVKYAAGARLPDGSRLSMSGAFDGSSASINRLTIAPSSDHLPVSKHDEGKDSLPWHRFRFALAPNSKVRITSGTTGEAVVEADLVASSKDLDSIKGLEPEVYSHSGVHFPVSEYDDHDDGHFSEVPQTIAARVIMKLRDFQAPSTESLGAMLAESVDEGDFHLREINAMITSATVSLLPTGHQKELLGQLQLPSFSFENVELELLPGLAPSPPFLKELQLVGRLKFWPPILLQEEHLNLCLQPVRVRHRECAHKPWFGFLCFSYTYTYSGSGLAFGKPAVEDQWGKVDITFTWRPWKTIIDNAGKYESVTTAEMSDFKNEIAADDDCVEIFFAPKFDPSSTYGGGACWGSGTAGAQIISSDEQVACGVDLTHLAHEVGHALGLMHPGTGHATYADGSTGTLLCGSGWQRDNPRRNSVDNGNNVVNPLLTCYMDTINWYSGPECGSSADCGSCAAHIPADSC